MDKLNQAIDNIHRLDDLARRETLLTRLHPLSKVLAILSYLVTVISFDRYDLSGEIGMGIFIIVVFEMGNIPFRHCMRQFKAIAWILGMIGLGGIYFDTSKVTEIAGFDVSGGVISAIVLMIKGMWSFMAVYALIASTGMEQICYALQCLRLPRILIVILLLIYRHMMLFLQECRRISTAYALRAPGQKGVHFRAWGSLLGQLLLRTIDKAQTVYESMALRGFQGVFYLQSRTSDKRASLAFFMTTAAYLTVFRFVPIFEYLGQLL